MNKLLDRALLTLAFLTFLTGSALGQSNPSNAQWQGPRTSGHTPVYNNSGWGVTIQDGGQRFVYASQYGADLTGATDTTTAVQNCLNAAGSMGACRINQGGTVKILGALTIPASTTLDCGLSFGDQSDAGNAAAYNTMPRIILGGPSISAGGESAKISNCLIVRNGLTFPTADSSGFAGTAINDQTKVGMRIENDVIIGFDRVIALTGLRPYVRNVYMDGTGVTNAALYVNNGQSDSGYFENIKIQPLATGNGLCPQSLRPGIGALFQGVNQVGVLISQNFQNRDVDIEAQTVADLIDTEFYSACARGSSVGIYVASNLYANKVMLNGSQTGITFQGNSIDRNTHINLLWFNNLGGDCAVFGAPGVTTGRIFIDTVITNTFVAGCGGYAFDYLDSTANTIVQIERGFLGAVNGGVAPYINLGVATSTGKLSFGNLVSDLPAGSSIIGGTVSTTTSLTTAATLAFPTTPDMFVLNGNGVTITNVTGVWPGRRILLYQPGSGTNTFGSGGNLRATSAFPLTLAASDVWLLQCNGSGSSVLCYVTKQ